MRRSTIELMRSFSAFGACFALSTVAFVACVGSDPVSSGPDASVTPIPTPTNDAAIAADSAVPPVVDAGGDTSAECVTATKECVGNKPRQCLGGRWQAPTTCTDDKPLCVGGECVTPPSCATLLGSCGASNPQNCCNAPIVEGATFNRFNNAALPATVSSVRLDRYEVTVARFRAFVASGLGTQANPPKAGAGAHPKVLGSGWSAGYNASLLATTAALTTELTSCGGFANATYAAAGNVASNNKPINCVSWFEAEAFCIYDGGRLPSVAEVELATRGGVQQRPYPWGTEALDATRLFYCSSNPNACTTPDGGNILDVGSKPLGGGRWGHQDLYGSMRDYGLDIYRPVPTACVDCVQTDTGAATTHAALGGSWADGSTAWPGIFNVSPTTSTNPRTPAGGFRCAHDL